MADDTTPANKSALRYVSQKWATTEGQARRKLQQFRDVQAETIRRDQLATVQSTSGPLPPPLQIKTEISSFAANPIASATPYNQTTVPVDVNGITVQTTVCVEDEDGNFTSATAYFVNGILTRIEMPP